MDYTTMCAKVVVTQVTSYDIVWRGGSIPPGDYVRFLGRNCILSTRMALGVIHKALLPMTFIRRQTKNSNKSTMLVRFLGLPHGFELLEHEIHD
jgi:hypothetical protein